MRKFFKSDNGEVHIGVVMIEGFSSMDETEIEGILKNLRGKKLWRCCVCNDLYIGISPPKQCPTCSAIEAYVEINENELKERIK